ncbi:MAG: DegV family protein [Candidatus Gottesmanbacteria bacterium]
MATPERALITDSTTSLDPHRAADFRNESGIRVISLPSWITIEEKPLPDFIIKTPDFYDRLGKSAELFNTSGANLGQFEKAYESLATHFGINEIFTILSDVRLTCGVNSATAATEAIKRKYPDMKIQVLDTQSVSVGAGILIPEAIELLKQDIPFEEISRKLELKAQNIKLFIAVSDAAYFLKSAGRRISKEGLEGVRTAVAALAMAFKVYPIVDLQEAKLIPKLLSRGKKGIPEKIIELIEKEKAKGKVLKRALVTHTNNEGRAQEMTDLLAARYNLSPKAIDYCEAGKVLAVYTGKDCLGVACLFE